MSREKVPSELVQVVEMSDVFSDVFRPEEQPGSEPQDRLCGSGRGWTGSPDPPGPGPGPGPGAGAGTDSGSEERSSMVERLLVELYEKCSSSRRRTADGWDSSTEASGSDAFLGRSASGSGFLQELQLKNTRRLQVNFLSQKGPDELSSIIQEVKYRSNLQSMKLIRQLRRRDRLAHKVQKNYDIITACLQAVSQKRRVDTRLKFTIEPSLGKNGFQQWYDALKAVARLPTGIPKEWRKRVWLTLADQYLHSISIDWDKTLRFAFNDRSNPDDDSLGIQIVKDLHRTGCSSYCGQEGEQDRVVLKRVLLAYARWNKSVGYCQGFNVLAALILEVTEGNESDALKVMIYLIDKVLPESYFANNLRALSVDMAVFRDLLRLKLPRLWQHLHHLQKAANREAGGSYEPPLTNVFTMQWFLTMFATCLPSSTVLKIWDSVFFEGSEILFRVALAIWERLGEKIEFCPTADQFYSTMGSLTQEMFEQDLIDASELMQEVYCMAVFPFPQLAELREKYTYNITPFPTSVKTKDLGGGLNGGLGSWDSDDDAEMDDEDSMVTALGCLGPLGGLLAPELQRYQKHLKDQRAEQENFTQLSPGAVGGAGAAVGGAKAEHQAAINSMMMERMSTDICALMKQYSRIKRRQQQQACIRTDKCPATRVLASQLNPSAAVINHLLLGRRPRGRTWFTAPGPQNGQSAPCRQNRGSAGSPGPCSGPGSPWRTHVRVHRRNIARSGAQLDFRSPEPGEEEEPEEEDEPEEEEGPEEEEEPEGEEDGDGPCPSAPGSEGGDVLEVEVKLDGLDLEEKDSAAPPPLESSGSEMSSSSPPPLPSPPPLVAPPSSFSPSSSPTPDSASIVPSDSSALSLPVSSPSSSTPSLSSISSSSKLRPSISPSCSAPKPQVFSPFPSVKQPRKSPAARNLGLYGPTSRTPTVHFPQLSRNLNRNCAGATTRRR